MRLLDHLLRAIRGAAVFNPEVEVAPVCGYIRVSQTVIIDRFISALSSYCCFK